VGRTSHEARILRANPRAYFCVDTAGEDTRGVRGRARVLVLDGDRDLAMDVGIDAIVEADFSGPGVRPQNATGAPTAHFDIGAVEQPHPNSPPIASAGTDQGTLAGFMVFLDGTGSSDPDSDPLTFAWVQTSGPTVTLNGASSATPNFTAPAVPVTSDLVFELTDGDGQAVATDRVTVTVTSLVPVLTSLAPDAAIANSSAFALTVTGNNFITSSVVTFGAEALTPIGFPSTTQLQVIVPLSLLGTAGPVPVTVTNPGPGGGSSNALTFTVHPIPVPTITLLSPDAGPAGVGFVLTVFGDDFTAGSVVNVGEQPLTPFMIGGGFVQVFVPGEALPAPGPVAVTVTNPGPGGGVSNALTFTAW
jgi:hypothetical protein